MDITETIDKLAKNAAESKGLSVAEWEHIRMGKRSVLRIYLDKPEGVTVEDCSAVSHALGVLLDVEDVLDNAYTLEVSSLGIDRPLTKPIHFQRNVGETLSVKYKDEDKKSQKLEGVLQEVGEDSIMLDTKVGSISVPLNNILKARVEVQF